jgi:hypothetical protein
MASAADEDSWHHNFPSNYAHTIVLNSIRDFGAPGGVPVVPNSWLYFNGCTNFGGNIAASISSTSCSSEAVGRGAGLAGLLVSAGRDAVDAMTLASPLTPNEVRQLLTQTADDIDFETLPGTRVVGFPDTIRYATQPGWDQFTGYGRININDAVTRVVDGDVPPEAEIDSPVWFQPLDPQRDGAFGVEGRVAAARATGYTYRVQIAYGIQPQEADYVDVVPFGATQSAPIDGLLATITPAQVPTPSVAQIARRIAQQPDMTSDYDEFSYTIRVQVRDQPGNQLGEGPAHRLRPPRPRPQARVSAAAPRPTAPRRPPSPTWTATASATSSSGPATASSTRSARTAATCRAGPVAGDAHPAQPRVHRRTPRRRFHFLSVVPSWPRWPSADIDDDGRLDVVAADMEGKVYAWNDGGGRKERLPRAGEPPASRATR